MKLYGREGLAVPDLLFQSVLQNGVTVPGVMLCTAAALVMGVCIALLHLRQGGGCTKSFAVTLALLPEIGRASCRERV